MLRQQPPSTYAPTPLYNNNNAGGMNTFMQSAPNTTGMTPHLIISGMQGLEDLLEVWVGIEDGWIAYLRHQCWYSEYSVGDSAMNSIGAMSDSEMSLNGGNMGPAMFSTVQPQQAITSPPAPPPAASGTDPFADLAGLF